MKRILCLLSALSLTAPAVAQQYVSGQVVTLTDGSGTVTAGGTSQQVFAANPYRHYLFCENPISATEPLFLNIDAAASTAGGSVEIAVGGSHTFASNAIPIGPVFVTATTTGHRFICKQG